MQQTGFLHSKFGSEPVEICKFYDFRPNKSLFKVAVNFSRCLRGSQNPYEPSMHALPSARL